MKHQSVLLAEAVEALNIHPDGIYIDATYGRGGHSTEILKKLGPNGRLIICDRDPDAISHAHKLLGHDRRVTIINSTFDKIKSFCAYYQMCGLVSGILFDLGISTEQITYADRGFSFDHPGPLDMRMDPSNGISAREVLKNHSVQSLANILYQYGEEFYAWPVARRIKTFLNQNEDFESTSELAELIATVIRSKIRHKHKRSKNSKKKFSKSEPGKHPATRCFQALRIYVNQELMQIENALEDVPDVLNTRGRLVVISFHSLEDRIVKKYIETQAKYYDSPSFRNMPITQYYKPSLKWQAKKIRPDFTELTKNPRARSAIMRVAERL